MTMSEKHLTQAIRRFLDDAGWNSAELAPLAGDASSRSYMRARQGQECAVLMIAPPNAETAPCPPAADEAARRALGYNASARLAGPNLGAFVAVAESLAAAKLSAPAILATDHEAGLALIEDLGDDLFARLVTEQNEAMLYRAAIDALLHIRRTHVTPQAGPHYTCLTYDGLALTTEMALLLDWYWPLKKEREASEDERTEFEQIAQTMTERLSPPSTLALRDFHAENLLWLPARQGPARVGLIDFQDALIGSPAYDVASLLEDARRDVAPELAADMIAYYCAEASSDRDFDEGEFLTDYAILAAQRNAKILGIFARLAKRDGKPRYLDLLPRVEAHFRRDLAREPAAPLARFVAKAMPELAP